MTTDRNYGVIRSAAKFGAFVDRILASGNDFGFDCESGYTGPPRADTALQTFHPNWVLAGFSFTNSLEWARYVPIAHDNGDNVDDVLATARHLWRLLQSGMGVAHHLAFELNGLSRWFLETLSDDPEVGAAVIEADGLFPYLSDSMVECFLAQRYPPASIPGGVGNALKPLVQHIFGHSMITFEELFPELKQGQSKKARFTTLELTPQVVTYACEDSVWCLALHRHPAHYAAMKTALVYKVEMALIVVLVRMEKVAMLLDWPEVSRKATEVLTLQAKANEEIQAILSQRLDEVVNINLNSSKQLGEILFKRLGVPVRSRSEKTGEPSTDKKALESVAKIEPVVRKVLAYRQIAKLHDSYLHKYETELNYAGNGRAYPNHNQIGAGTGRMSVDGVSYQQWPKPYHFVLDDGTTFDMNFKNLCLSGPHERIVGFDFSQIELRVLAGVAHEVTMLAAFAAGTDIHRATASSMMRIPLEQVTHKVRATGKTVNFAVVYGSGAENIASLISTPDEPVTEADAVLLLEKYFAAFPNLRAWMDTKIAEGHQQGYVETLFGRRFTVWEFASDNAYIRSKGDRMCVNAPIQGGAADYLKIAMVRCDKAIRAAGMAGKIRMFLTIHDALEFYVDDDVSTQDVLDLVGPQVSFAIAGLPEIRADWHEGRTWGSVVEIAQDGAGQITGYSVEDGAGMVHEFATIKAAYAWQDALTDAPGPVVTTEVTEAVSVAPRASVVTIAQMPDENQWTLFTQFLVRHPGTTGVTIVTPEGSVHFPDVTLAKDDQPAVSALLGGASLTFMDSGVDLLAGLAL